MTTVLSGVGLVIVFQESGQLHCQRSRTSGVIFSVVASVLRLGRAMCSRRPEIYFKQEHVITPGTLPACDLFTFGLEKKFFGLGCCTTSTMRTKKRILQGAAVCTWLAMTTGWAEAAEPEPAGEQTCVEVRGFHDGDTFTCVTEEGALRVRVAGIDAPEVGQGFWRVSRDLLRSSTPAGSLVNCYKVDRFKRQVCRVASPTGSDIALELVKTGLAWRTRKYVDEQTHEERELFTEAETIAREQGLGLWSQPDPQEPSACRALKEQRQKCR